MKKILLALLLFAGAARAVDTLTIPTDFNTVTNGTRANLAGNFSAIGTWGNKIRDTLSPVTGVISGFSGTLLIRSLSNLRLKLDYDNTETAKLLVEGGNGDSLFRVSEDTTARFFRHLKIDSNLTVQKVTAADTVIGANLKTGGSLTVTGNGTIAKLTASDSVIGANLKTGGSLTVTGNETVAKITASDTIQTTGAAKIGGNLAVTGTTSSTGNILVNGAANETHGRLIAKDGYIAATGNYGFYAFGSGVPSGGSSQFAYLHHDGTNAILEGGESGSTYTPLVLKTSGTVAESIATNGGATFASTLGVTGKLTASDSIIGFSERLTGNINSLGAKAIFNTNTTDSTIIKGILKASAPFVMNGPLIQTVTTVSSNLKFNNTTHHFILIDASGGTIIDTLPSAVGNTGLTYTFAKKAGSFGINILPQVAQFVGPYNNLAFGGGATDAWATITSDGSNWQIDDYYEDGSFTYGMRGNTNDTSRGWNGSYSRNTLFATIRLAAASGTSNATTFKADTLPAIIRPTNSQTLRVMLQDNGSNVGALADIESNGVITFSIESVSGTKVNFNSSGFTASGTKGIAGNGFSSNDLILTYYLY